MDTVLHGVAKSWTLLSDLKKKKEYHTNGIRWYLALCILWPLSHSIMNVRFIIVKNTSLSGDTLGITDEMEARPQNPLLIPQAQSRDERVRPCNSDLSFPFLG